MATLIVTPKRDSSHDEPIPHAAKSDPFPMSQESEDLRPPLGKTQFGPREVSLAKES